MNSYVKFRQNNSEWEFVLPWTPCITVNVSRALTKLLGEKRPEAELFLSPFLLIYKTLLHTLEASREIKVIKSLPILCMHEEQNGGKVRKTASLMEGGGVEGGGQGYWLQSRAIRALHKLIPKILCHGAETWNWATWWKANEKAFLCYLPFSVFSQLSDFLPFRLSVTELGPLQHQPHHLLWGLGPVFFPNLQSCPLSDIFLHWVLVLSFPHPRTCIKQHWPPLSTKLESLALQKKTSCAYQCF